MGSQPDKGFILSLLAYQESLLQAYRGFNITFQSIVVAIAASVTGMAISASVSQLLKIAFVVACMYLFSRKFERILQAQITRRGWDVDYLQKVLGRSEASPGRVSATPYSEWLAARRGVVWREKPVTVRGRWRLLQRWLGRRSHSARNSLGSIVDSCVQPVWFALALTLTVRALQLIFESETLSPGLRIWLADISYWTTLCGLTIWLLTSLGRCIAAGIYARLEYFQSLPESARALNLARWFFLGRTGFGLNRQERSDLATSIFRAVKTGSSSFDEILPELWSGRTVIAIRFEEVVNRPSLGLTVADLSKVVKSVITELPVPDGSSSHSYHVLSRFVELKSLLDEEDRESLESDFGLGDDLWRLSRRMANMGHGEPLSRADLEAITGGSAALAGCVIGQQDAEYAFTKNFEWIGVVGANAQVEETASSMGYRWKCSHTVRHNDVRYFQRSR